MAASNKDLWTHVLKTATKGVSFLCCDLGKTKICDFDVSTKIEHDVLRFEISVDNIFLMQILNSQQNLDKVLFGLFLLEPHHSPLQMKKLPSWTIVQHHDKVQVSLDEIFHMHQKWKRNRLVDFLFILNKSIFLFQLCLLNKFGRVKGTICIIPYQIHFAETPHPYAL